MSLGDSLRKAMEKLRNSSSIDKETVKEAVKQIQRALIAGDVEITLVMKISKEIEEEAFKDLPKGINRKEHIIKITHDKLAGILGGKTKVPEKPGKILLVGLFGSGKCVHPETMIPMPDGKITTIKEIYDNNPETAFTLEDGYVKELAKPLEVFSLDPVSMKNTKGKVTHIWKLKKDKPLYKITLDNGNNHQVTVTQEHPFFVLEHGKIHKTRADEIKIGQYIATPKKLRNTHCQNDISAEVMSILLPNWIIVNQNLANQAKKMLIEKYGTLKNAFSSFGENYSYITFVANLKAGELRVSTLRKLEKLEFKYESEEEITVKRSGSAARKVKIPTQINPELGEFLGYVCADGHMRKQYLEIVNEDDDIINRIETIGKNIFGINPITKPDNRTVALRDIRFCSVILAEVFNRLFYIPYNKKSDKIRVPKQVLLADEPTRKSFLQAYFDCDGYTRDGTRSIEFSTASRFMGEEIRIMLSAFGFVPGYSRKIINNKTHYRIFVKSKDVEKFYIKIGSRIRFKHERLSKSIEIGRGQTFGKQEMLHVGKKLKHYREYMGATIGEIQKHVPSYGTYESEGLISRNSLRKFIKAIKTTKNKNNSILKATLNGANLNEINKLVNEPHTWTNAVVHRLCQQDYLAYSNKYLQITEKGRKLLEKNAAFDESIVLQLEKLAESEISWIKVKKMELVNNADFVYDLTVENYHNFVANHTIVHNTTTTGKLAKWYSKRGLKVGVIAADVYRPAAYKQLKTLAENAKVEFYGNEKEKNSVKIINEGLKKLEKSDLIICDSAGRSALDEELTKEIRAIDKAFGAKEKWLVIGADVGQVAKKQANAFHESIGVNGVIITKMDGSAKGGGALTACNQTGAKVYF